MMLMRTVEELEPRRTFCNLGDKDCSVKLLVEVEGLGFLVARYVGFVQDSLDELWLLRAIGEKTSGILAVVEYDGETRRVLTHKEIEEQANNER